MATGALGRLELIAATVIVVSGCADRPLDQDFRSEVDQICGQFCSTLLECQPDPSFSSQAECEESCKGMGFIYNDSDCGDAFRQFYACIGGVGSCKAYFDTHDVDANDYTCKAEKDRVAELGCWGTSEDPYEDAP